MILRKAKPKQIKGNALHVSVSIGARFSSAIRKEIDAMVKDTERAINELFGSGDYAGDYGMDANVGSQARITINQLIEKWDRRFAGIAGDAANPMIEQVKMNSAVTLAASMRQAMAQQITLDFNLITPEMKEMFAASAAEASGLIKSIPSKYLDDVGGAVYRSITSGNGLADLVPMLEQYKVSIRNWAHNTALDQTRKVYNHTNTARMSKLGMKKYEWVHSGGGRHPRKLHEEMNGNIYSTDNPPFIGIMYGQRVYGIPGDLPNCKCVQRFIIDFGDD